MSSFPLSKRFVSSLTVAVSCAFAGGSFAQEATPDTWMQTASTQTREQVRAEAAQARRPAAGANVFADGYIESLPVARTRLQVRAEVIAARNSGELAAINSEAHDFAAVRSPVVLADKK